MNEVHRYKVVTMLSAAGATIGYDPHGPDVVMASAFDEATRLFLDAAERCVASERREKELQQRLTAADERVDQQSRALLEVVAACALAMSAMDDDERGANFVKIIEAIKAKAALKPAEGGGDDRHAAVKPFKFPERKSSVDVFSTYGLGECAGWNKCLGALGDAFGCE